VAATMAEEACSAWCGRKKENGALGLVLVLKKRGEVVGRGGRWVRVNCVQI
jgi:hypothetical protein